jgi:lipoyl(octanoyl) transferase
MADSAMMRVRWLGRVPYLEALELQRQSIGRRRAGSAPDTLLLLEHPPVITLGRGSDRAHVLAVPSELRKRGIEVHECGRGGDVTFHGPGQLVGYPILALGPHRRDAHRYLRDLEEALIRTASDFAVHAERVRGLTGIWVGQRKLGAIGVRLSTGWITSHGFAFNVGPQHEGFSAIVPCGLRDRGVTSLSELTGNTPRLHDVASRVALHLARVLDRTPRASERPGERLELDWPPMAMRA